MKLDTFITRPIMAIALNLVLLILGFVALQQLELRHVSEQKSNDFKIEAHYPGANSLSVEHRITKPLEDSLSGLDGIHKITSESSDGSSKVHVRFKNNVDYKTALSELRDRVYMAMSELPESLKRPEIIPQGEQTKPLMYLAFSDQKRSVAALSDYIRRMVEDRIKMIDGVSEVVRFGNKQYEVSIELDPARLMEYGITANDVVNTLKQERSYGLGGEIEKIGGKENVILNLSTQNPKELSEVTIKILPTHRIQVKDVAEVKIIENPGFLRIRMEGQETVGLQINAKQGANPFKVANLVKQFVSDLQKNLPSSMKAWVTYDGTEAFQDSLKELKGTIWEAIFLVGVIMLFALASFRAAFFPMVTVPLCLMGTFAFMWALGFSLNPITLLALVLAVGLVVDDAIVVVENCHRYMEEGYSALEASKKSMKEITFAIIVMTITLAAVFLPVAFQQDDSARMLSEFSWTLAGSVLISGFVALTLTPALCSKYLVLGKKVQYWQVLTNQYQKLLKLALHYPGKVCAVALLIPLLDIVGFYQLGSELVPIEDENFIQGSISSSNAVPESVRDGWMKEVEKIAGTIPERSRMFTWEWQQRWLGWSMILKPRKERSRGAAEIVEELNEKFKAIGGPTVSAQIGEEGSLGGNEPLKAIIQYSGDYQQLMEIVKNIQNKIRMHPDFQRVASEQVWEITRLQVDVDKKLAQELGVGMDSIENTLYTFLSGRKATDFNFRGFDYNVFVRAAKQFRSELSGINEFFVVGGEGQWIPLGSLVSLKEVLGPARIKHSNRMRAATISIFLKPGVSLDKAMAVIEPLVKKYMPKDAVFRFGGNAEKYQEAKESLWLTYALAIVFIYLILTALFESFIHPLIVLLTVPLSITGAVWAIQLMGGTNNIYTAIGFITLVGLITKHGILIVDFANRLRAQGFSLQEAILKASEQRLRPILMTTLAMIGGAIPLVFSMGAGAVAREHVGLVIIGGMITGTAFSLFIVPVGYSLIHAKTFRPKLWKFRNQRNTSLNLTA